MTDLKNKIEEILRSHYAFEKTKAVSDFLQLIKENYIPKEEAKTNPYHLSDTEYKKMEELKSHTVKLEGGNGIGIGVDCLVKGKWVDITDYSNW